MNLLIIYWDGTMHVVENVTRYGYLEEGNVYYYEKNLDQSFMPKEAIRFIGIQSDYKNVG